MAPCIARIFSELTGGVMKEAKRYLLTDQGIRAARAKNPLWAPGKFVQYDCTPSAPNNSFCAEIVDQTTQLIERVMRFPSVF